MRRSSCSSAPALLMVKLSQNSHATTGEQVAHGLFTCPPFRPAQLIWSEIRLRARLICRQVRAQRVRILCRAHTFTHTFSQAVSLRELAQFS